MLKPSLYGGKCDLIEHRECNIAPCPQDCAVNPWSQWSACTVSCGSGTRHRTRSLRIPSKYGGKECPQLYELEECNTKNCQPNTQQKCDFSPVRGPLDPSRPGRPQIHSWV